MVNDKILTLQKAFSTFYGAQRDPQTALSLLDESVANFQIALFLMDRYINPNSEGCRREYWLMNHIRFQTKDF